MAYIVTVWHSNPSPMEDSKEDTPQAEPIIVPPPPQSPDVEPEPADVTVPKFLYSTNTKPFDKEDVE